MLRVQLVSGAYADDVTRRLREHDNTGLLAVTVVERPGLAAIVITAKHCRIDERVADVVLDEDEPLAPQVDRLMVSRLVPFARALAGIRREEPGPPVLRAHDPQLPAAAQRMLERLRGGLTRRGLDDGSWSYDHIDSTAVPGLRAKPLIDLQIGVGSLPKEGSQADQVLAAAGFPPTTGARPDSPGVYRDGIKDPGLAPAAAYRKRLYFRPDPAQPAVLHVRQLGSPWWSYTVRFRDWLRANPRARRDYEEAKQRAAVAHARDMDFDGYTRAKAAFFDQVQAEYQRPAPDQDPPGRRP